MYIFLSGALIKFQKFEIINKIINKNFQILPNLLTYLLEILYLL